MIFFTALLLFIFLLPLSPGHLNAEIFESKLEEDFKKLAIKGGLGLSHVKIQREKTQDKFVTPVINTQLTLSMGDFELSANGTMSFGKINGLTYNVNGDDITGVGHVLDLSLGPILKYQTKFAFSQGRWPIHIGAGPSWALYSIKFRDNDQIKNRDYDISVNEFKLSYNTVGYNIVVGVEERADSKSLHPVYIELVYSYRKSRKLSLVDTEKFEEIEVAHEQDDESMRIHSFMINMGITFF